MAVEHILDVVLMASSVNVDADGGQITDEQYKEFGATFDVIDQDKSGEISLQEMLGLFVALGSDLPEEKVRCGDVLILYCFLMGGGA